MAQQLSEVFPLENNEMKSFEGYGQFITFVEKWESKYPALRKYKAERNSAYFTYMDFPAKCRGAYIRPIGLKGSTGSTREPST